MNWLDSYIYLIDNFKVFLLVLTRVGAIFFMMPVFSSRALPTQIKAASSLVMAICLTPFVPLNSRDFPDSTIQYVFYVVSELFVGISLALILRLIFAGLQTAAQMAGFQIGFSVANIVDPHSGTQSVVVAEFAYLFALLLFLTANGHHYVLKVLHDSFWILRPGELHLTRPIYDLVVDFGGKMFMLSVKLMAPVMTVLLLGQVALGILAKTVPQMNMLIMSFGLNVILGLFFLGITIQVFWPMLAHEIDACLKLYPGLIMAFSGR